MSGSGANRGFQLQAIAAVEMAIEDSLWTEIRVEAEEISEKVDLAFFYGSNSNKDRLIQVKSTLGSFTKGETAKWCEQLATTEFPGCKVLLLVGRCTDGVPEQSGSVTIMRYGTALPEERTQILSQRLTRYLSSQAVHSPPAAIIEAIAGSLVNLLLSKASMQKRLPRAEFTNHIATSILELIPSVMRDQQRELEELRTQHQSALLMTERVLDIRFSCCLDALALIDNHLASLLQETVDQPSEDMRISTARARRVHSALMLTVKNPEIVICFELIMFSSLKEGELMTSSDLHRNYKSQLSNLLGVKKLNLFDALNHLRQLIRRELGVKEELSLTTEQAWLAVLGANRP